MTAIRWVAALPVLAFAWALGAETNQDVSESSDAPAQSKLVVEDGADLYGVPLAEVEQCLSLCDCLGGITVVPDCDQPESECLDGFDTRYVDDIEVRSFRHNGALVLQSKFRKNGGMVSRVSDPISAGLFAQRDCQCNAPESGVIIRETDKNRDGKADHRRTTCSIRGAKMLLEVEEVAGEQEGEWRVRRALRTSRLVH